MRTVLLNMRVVGVLGLTVSAGVLACAGGCQDRAVEVSMDTYLEYEDKRAGRGLAAGRGDLVSVHYRAELSDGKEVLNTKTARRGNPHRFYVGDGTVVPGMDQAVRGMKPGGVRHVLMPPRMHYGMAGYGDVIPPKSDLHFVIEMVAVTPSSNAPEMNVNDGEPAG